jgi:hypothetical protein
MVLLIVAIANLGDLALTEYALNHGAEVAARTASIDVTNNIASVGATNFTTAQCPTQAALQNVFNQAVNPPIPNPAQGQIAVTWGGVLQAACAPPGTASAIPGGSVSVSVRYIWHPLVFGQKFLATPLGAAATDQVMLASSL